MSRQRTTAKLRDVSLCAAAVVVIAWVFVRVSKDEIRAEDTATEEMRARTLDFYKNRLNDERASRDGLTPSRDRIAESAATVNSNASR